MSVMFNESALIDWRGKSVQEWLGEYLSWVNDCSDGAYLGYKSPMATLMRGNVQQSSNVRPRVLNYSITDLEAITIRDWLAQLRRTQVVDLCGCGLVLIHLYERGNSYRAVAANLELSLARVQKLEQRGLGWIQGRMGLC